MSLSANPELRPLPQPRPSLWPATIQLVLVLLAITGLGGLAAGLLSIGTVTQLRSAGLGSESIPMLSLALGLALDAVLLLPAGLFPLLQILGRPAPFFFKQAARWFDRWTPFVILLWPVVLLIGQWVVNQAAVAWVLLPPINILVTAIPVLWLVSIGRRGLAIGSNSRAWGIFGFGLVVSPLLIGSIEIVIFLGIAVLGIIWVASNPNAALEINRLAQRLMLSQGDPETLVRILRPFLARPWVAFTGLTLIAGLTPLIEELLKPLVLWGFARRTLTPVDGFIGGMLCGAGVALAESLNAVTTQVGENWITVAIGRGGTDLMHILTTGLMGWALISAWNEGKILRLGVTFLAAVGMHGLWNALNIGTGLASFVSVSPGGWLSADRLNLIIFISLLFLVAIMLAVFLLFSNRLKSRRADSSATDPSATDAAV
jgi:hypothetical protein